jgi:Fe-S cluster biosynthesis and repair protein YggX
MARYQKTMWMVDCVKLGREAQALDRPPFGGELGQRIFDNISKEAWQLWKDQQVLLVNHYGLNLADPQAQTFLMTEMEEFFFGENAKMPEGWTPPTQNTKGGQQTK